MIASRAVLALFLSTLYLAPANGQFSSQVVNSTGIGNVTGLGTGVAAALGIAVGSAGGPVTFNGALGSPSSVGTLPAHTLGGTISGGGNQINNVIIGTSTPLGASFTTLAASGLVTLTNATDATSTSAAAVVLSGGLAVAKKIYSGDNVLIGLTTNCFNSTTVTGNYLKTAGVEACAAGTVMLINRNNTAGAGDLFGFYYNAGGVGSLTTDTTGIGMNSTGVLKLIGTSVQLSVLANAATTSALCYNTGTFVVTYNSTVGTCTVSILAAKDLKHRLSPIDGYNIVMAMDPWVYELKKGLPTYVPGEQIGFVADWVKTDSLVARDPDGKITGMRYEQYTAALTAAFRYLKSENDNLRAANDNLAQRVTQLEKNL